MLDKHLAALRLEPHKWGSKIFRHLTNPGVNVWASGKKPGQSYSPTRMNRNQIPSWTASAPDFICDTLLTLSAALA
jgi:hypothetical protein